MERLHIWLTAPGLALALCTPATAQCEDRFGPPDVSGFFGTALDIDGARVLVGAHSDDHAGFWTGAAYVFERVGEAWVAQQRLEAADAHAYDYFGYDVALDGGVAVIGAYRHGDDREGAAYFFEFDGTSWVEVQRIDAPHPDWSSHYGISVDVEGDTAVVGANDYASGAFSGSVYVYERGSVRWTETARLIPPDGEPNDHFSNVELDGDTLTVGAVGGDAPTVDGSGCVYVYRRLGAGWALETKLTADDAAPVVYFGASTSLDGDRLAVGCPGDDERGENAGAVYVFERSGSAWQQTEKLFASDATGGEFGGSRFGERVALQGDLLAVAAPSHDTGVFNAGKAYLFLHEEGSWNERRSLVASEQDDEFGRDTALDGNALLLGSKRLENHGVVFAYELDCLLAFEDYCRCRSGAPCGNSDALAGCANSTGRGATLSAGQLGTNSVSSDDLVLRVEGLPLNTFGLVYVGGERDCAPFGDGLRAVQPGPPGFDYHRFPVQSSGPLGWFDQGPGLVAYSHQHFGPLGAIQPGSTWNFQAYYRDVGGPCGAGFNLTQALTVEFAP